MKILLLPPASLLVLGLSGWLLRRRWPRVGRGLLGAAVALLFVLSTPLASGFLRRALEVHPALDAAGLSQVRGADAIVVLGADFVPWAPEWPAADGETVGDLTLQRLRYGAWLHRQTGVPLATCGGVLRGGTRPLSHLMRAALEEELGCTVRWVEERSGSTWQNARGFGWIAGREGLARVALVTHAWHMPRAVAAFEAVGLEVLPAPTDFRAPPRAALGEVLPSAGALHESALALHEWIGRLWYRLRYTERF